MNLQKWLLVDAGEQDKNRIKNLRRYLSGHNINAIQATCLEEVLEWMIMLETQKVNELKKELEDSESNQDQIGEEIEQNLLEVTISSNQELLEKWASERFPQDSKEYQLLFGGKTNGSVNLFEDCEAKLATGDSYTKSTAAHCDRELEDSSICKTASSVEWRDSLLVDHFDDAQAIDFIKKDSDYKSSPKRNAEPFPFLLGGRKIIRSYNQINDSSDEDDQPRKSDKHIMCNLCEVMIEVGTKRSRQARIKRQAIHVIEAHPKDLFVNVQIEERYRCVKCSRVLPIQKSPCEHISDYHSEDKEEVEFSDLWKPEELNEFNNTLYDCFGRYLPIPRGRRARADEDSSIGTKKSSYRIKQGDVVTEKTTVEETRHIPHDHSYGMNDDDCRIEYDTYENEYDMNGMNYDQNQSEWNFSSESDNVGY